MPIKCRITWVVVIENKIEIDGTSASFIGIAEPMIERGNQSKDTCWQCRVGAFRGHWKQLIDLRDSFVQNATEARGFTKVNLKKIGNGLLCFKPLLESKRITRALLRRIREHTCSDVDIHREANYFLRNTTTQKFRSNEGTA